MNSTRIIRWKLSRWKQICQSIHIIWNLPWPLKCYVFHTRGGIIIHLASNLIEIFLHRPSIFTIYIKDLLQVWMKVLYRMLVFMSSEQCSCKSDREDWWKADGGRNQRPCHKWYHRFQSRRPMVQNRTKKALHRIAPRKFRSKSYGSGFAPHDITKSWCIDSLHSAWIICI